jgi:hypothetical protein
MLTDYDHGFDKYNGESILFMDEFRRQMKFSLFLTLIGGYKVQVPCRYSNVYGLWNEVHITSVLPPERVYENMVQDNRHLDTVDQLMRRISFVVYHCIPISNTRPSPKTTIAVPMQQKKRGNTPRIVSTNHCF